MNVDVQLMHGQQRQANMRRCFFVCAIFFVIANLGACTTTPLVPPATVTLPAGQSALAAYFSLNGRISVRVNDKVDSGQIRWNRSAVEERIGLYSPLGTQVAELISNKRTGMVTLRQANETSSAASVAELTQSLLGVALDLDRMAAWVQGVGLRENENTDMTLGNGEIWRVTAERYVASGQYRFASRVTATSGDIMVRLVIDEWTPQ